MQTLIFKVQGSAAEPYRVTIDLDGDNLTAHCTCPAGAVGQYCKHRFGILAGKTDNVVSANTADVATAASWLPGTDVQAAMDALEDADAQKTYWTKQVSARKKAVARAMRD